MNIFTRITKIKQAYPAIAVALGTFDGIHVGHQQVIGGAIEWAKRNGGASAVFTFSNHPLSFISPLACPPLIYQNEVKARLLAQMGVDVLFNIPFTPELLQMSPRAFIATLHDNMAPRQITIGPNYSFGYKGQGTPEMLREEEEKLGCEVRVFPAVTLGGVIVSSTAIRQHVAEGRIEKASALLGRPYGLYDLTVMNGDKRGRTLGYPTANMALPAGVLTPPNGVYAVRVRSGDHMLNAVANLGINPTFKNGQARRLEVHILDFDQTIYHQQLDVFFYKRLRQEQKFENAHQLIRQIAADVDLARSILTGQ